MNNTPNFLNKNVLRLLLAVFSAAVFILSGCQFDYPVASVPNAQIDENLIGVWKSPDYRTVKISKIDDEHYRVSYDDKPFLVAYHTDFESRRFITGMNVDKGKFLIFTYDLENNSQRLRLKTVGYDVVPANSSSSSEIQKLIGSNMDNPKLFMHEDVFERVAPPVNYGVSVGKPIINKQIPAVKSGLFRSDDTDIYYEIYGAEKTATPLVVLHGGPGFDHQYFLSNSAFTSLAKNRPVVFYDQRGTGKSAKLKAGQTATLRNGLEDLLRLTKFLGYDKIDLAGHSWGGFQAMTYAIAFPERISHLIIIDSMSENFDDYDKYVKFEDEFPNEYRAMVTKRTEALFNNDEKAMRASIVEYMKMLLHSPQNRDRFIAGSDKFTYDSSVNRTVVSSAEGVDLTARLRKLNIPTLILHGRFDANIGVESAEEIHNTIPNSQLVIFEQSGHLPFYEEKEKFVSTVEKFLAN